MVTPPIATTPVDHFLSEFNRKLGQTTEDGYFVQPKDNDLKVIERRAEELETFIQNNTRLILAASPKDFLKITQVFERAKIIMNSSERFARACQILSRTPAKVLLEIHEARTTEHDPEREGIGPLLNFMSAIQDIYEAKTLKAKL